MERCDFVNDNLRLIQDTEGLTFGTDALLLAGYINGRYKRGLELGCGSGIISMLLLTRSKADKVVALTTIAVGADTVLGLGDRLAVSERCKLDKFALSALAFSGFNS